MEWKNINQVTPLAYESGSWDGLRTDELLVYCSDGKFHVARMYEGYLDGSSFREFYDQNDYEIESVQAWLEIEKP